MLNHYLTALKPQQTATIANLHPETGLNHRLQALGFRVGQNVVMLRKAWFAGPVHVRVGMTEVILRRQEASKIEVVNITNLVSVDAARKPKITTLINS
ncbi:FeoA family protein [Richelia sinica]|nr:FeoA family protein [Richelia sinica]MBD2667024.1 ferrous iron transport protein A [Richelia sinica FACHB-800]